MKTIGNIIWFICGGFLAALMWLMSGVLCYITVVAYRLASSALNLRVCPPLRSARI